MAKNKDIRPWLDFFQMLQVYERSGYLEVMPDKHETYITLPALYTLSDDGRTFLGHVAKGIPSILRNIRTYSGWKSRQGGDYLKKPFAIHVVDADAPHDMLYTFLLTRQRKWHHFWRKTDTIELIAYENPAK